MTAIFFFTTFGRHIYSRKMGSKMLTYISFFFQRFPHMERSHKIHPKRKLVITSTKMSPRATSTGGGLVSTSTKMSPRATSTGGACVNKHKNVPASNKHRGGLCQQAQKCPRELQAQGGGLCQQAQKCPRELGSWGGAAMTNTSLEQNFETFENGKVQENTLLSGKAFSLHPHSSGTKTETKSILSFLSIQYCNQSLFRREIK